jgi:hypothetical protein
LKTARGISPLLQAAANEPEVRQALALMRRQQKPLPLERPYKIRLKEVSPKLEDVIRRVLTLEADVRSLKGATP